MIRRSVVLAAGRARVWEFVTDPGNFAAYVSGYVAGEAVEGSRRGLGATYAWSGALGPLRVRARERIVEWQPESRVAYSGELAGVGFRSAIELADLGEERTRVTVEIEPTVRLPFGGRAAEAVLAPLVDHHVRRSLGRLQDRFGSGGIRPGDDPGAQAVRMVYRMWGLHPGLYAAQDWVTFLGRPGVIRGRAVGALGVGAGARVLEVACGGGRNFPYLERVIGPGGQLVGLDLSSEMLEAAAALVRARGWRNVRLIEGDAARLEVGEGGFDGILAVLGMSAIPDHASALRRCYQALRPGGVLAVCDAGRFTAGPPALNALVEELYVRLACWHPERDLPADIAGVFGQVVVESLNLGTLFIATGRKTRGAGTASC